MYSFCRFFLICLCINAVKCEIVNTKVNQIIDIKTSLVKINTSLKFKNLELDYISSYSYLLDPDVIDHYIKFSNVNGTELTSQKFINDTTIGYRINLDQNLYSNKSYEIKVESVLLNKIAPLLRNIFYGQVDYASYKGNLYFYSPYKTLLLRKTYIVVTTEDLQNSHVASYTLNNNLIYIYHNVKPFRFEQHEMEYKNNVQMLTITNLKRIICISHWGKMCIQDKINIKNEGSKLVGPYEPNLKDTAIANSHWWYTHLPAAVDEIQYYDTIGNNSKSVLLHFETHKTFKFQPRYPLMGGWKTFYVIKYCVPTHEYLYHNPRGLFYLKVRAIDHVLDNVVIKQMGTMVLLPEGSHIIATKIPQGFQEKKGGKCFTSLCIRGRPTIFLNGSNILENHIDYLTVQYSFHTLYLLRVPLLLSVYIEVVFLVVILVIHIK